MNLSVRDAATTLGCSPRTLRAMLLDGRIAGYKRGGRWIIPRRNLPLTDAQRRKVEDAVDDLHAAVDDAVPAHIRRQLGGGVAELRAFAHGRSVLEELQAAGAAPDAAAALREGLCALAEGHHQYAAAVKIDALTHARACVSRAAAALLLTPESPAAPGDALIRMAATLESEALPPIGGLLRRAEALPARRAS